MAARIAKKLIERVHLGQSFAEYDSTLDRDDVFVYTPAMAAATDWSNPHCFFVGRRGTGKTTIARYVERTNSRAVIIRPEIFSPSGSDLPVESFHDAKQKPFRSLTAAFRRSLQTEVIMTWADRDHLDDRTLGEELSKELHTYQDLDFDLRVLQYIEDLTKPLATGDDKTWVQHIKVPKLHGKALSSLPHADSARYTLLLDAIDDSWDGSQLAVIYLSALLHAALEINTQNQGMRVLVFLRENIFERIRRQDSEFSRLETCVVGLDWSEAQLLEMVERRLNAPLTAKSKLGGETWDLFFEDGASSRRMVFDFCQRRPRDVITYAGLALDNAQARKHEIITLQDLAAAKRRFSDSRLKDLGDEYQENFPQISLVLSRFYGLGGRWTLVGLDGFLNRLILDESIQKACGDWLYDVGSPHEFAQLLFNVGFFGIVEADKRRGASSGPVFRSLGPSDTTPPPLSGRTDLIIHPSYWEALDLQDVLMQSFGPDTPFGRAGLQVDLPESIDFTVHQERLRELHDTIKFLPTGRDSASAFEAAVGEVLELCFFRSLANIEAQVRNTAGTVRRDWVASNRGQTGFWQMILQRYDATSIVFECKNYEELEASDFHQAAYYMTRPGGRFVFLVFRGDIKNHYFEHVSRVAQGPDGLVLLLNAKDLLVFVRQALNGRVKDDHLLDRYDKTIRAIS